VKILIGCLLVWGCAALAATDQADAMLSPGLAKVVQMMDSGVSEDVVLAYVQNSAVPRPNADEVIRLHEAGVPDRVTLALLAKKAAVSGEHNGKNGSNGNNERVITRPSYAQPQATAPQTAPVYVQSAPVYVQREPVVVYSSPVYSSPAYYDYPYYRYNYGYSWPVISLGFDFAFGHHGFFHGGHFGGHQGFVGVHHGGHLGRHW